MVPVSRPDGATRGQGPGGPRPPAPTARELALAANAASSDKRRAPRPRINGSRPAESSARLARRPCREGDPYALSQRLRLPADLGAAPGSSWRKARSTSRSRRRARVRRSSPAASAPSIYMTPASSEPLAARIRPARIKDACLRFRPASELTANSDELTKTRKDESTKRKR